MEFYKTVSIVAICILMISLAVMATLLIAGSKNVQFPPYMAPCPDYYKNSKNEKGQIVCEDEQNISNGTSNCVAKKFNHQKFKMPGMGPTSGACKKKKWANRCGVDWDGITNNSDVCYKVNEDK